MAYLCSAPMPCVWETWLLPCLWHVKGSLIFSFQNVTHLVSMALSYNAEVTWLRNALSPAKIGVLCFRLTSCKGLSPGSQKSSKDYALLNYILITSCWITLPLWWNTEPGRASWYCSLLCHSQCTWVAHDLYVLRWLFVKQKY